MKKLFNYLRRATRNIAHWPGAPLILTSEDFCIGITQLDGNISFQLILETHSLHTRQCLYHSRFTMSYMTNGA